MSNSNNYRRIIWLHDHIKKKGFVTKEAYLEEVERTERTFYRDIDRLRLDFNAPVEAKEGRYYYTDESFELPAMLLSEQDLFGLLIATNVLNQYRGTPMYASIKQIVNRLASNLATDLEYFYLDSMSSNKNKDFSWEHLQLLTRAIAEKRQVNMEYHSFRQNQVAIRKVNPLHIYNYKGDFYLIAYCYKNEEVRDFLLTRISDLELDDEIFRIGDFDLKEYLSEKQWGIIKGGEDVFVRFKISAQKAPWIRENQNLEFIEKSRDKDWVEFEVQAKLSGDFVNWLLGFGGDLEVMAPLKLKNMIIDKCNRVLENYN